MKVSLAVIALLGLTSAHKHHHRKPQHVSNLQFIDGDFNDMTAPENYLYNTPSAPVAMPIAERMSLIQAKSDPIHGSLGPNDKLVKSE